jgi:capsid protein
MRSRCVYAFKHIITLVDKYLQQKGEAMSRKLLHEVRDVLKQSNAIVSEREFCERWLGKSECYMRTLRFNTIEPSADALATVSNKLRYYSDQMQMSEQTDLCTQGVEFERLAEACWASIQTTARRKWAAAA